MQTLTRIETGPDADYTVVADMDAIWIHSHDGMHTETMRIDAEALEAVGVALIAAAVSARRTGPAVVVEFPKRVGGSARL